MRKFLTWIFVLCFIIFSVSADEITLKNGDRISGTILTMDSNFIIVQTQYGKLEVARTDIKRAIIENDGNSITEGVQPKNIALASLGAITGDNGYFRDAGYTPKPSSNVIDGNSATDWAGLQKTQPQQIWITFGKTYTISSIKITEVAEAYIRNGILEYLDGDNWQKLVSINKNSAGGTYTFSPVMTQRIRLSISAITAPSGWYNRVACITGIEVYGY